MVFLYFFVIDTFVIDRFVIDTFVIDTYVIDRPDGYILHAYLSFFVSKQHNDGNILYYIINKTNLTNVLPASKHLALVDRGFWPLIEKLTQEERNNLFDHISPCLANDKPLPTLDVNLSRLCTSNRFVIEMVFGVIKQQWRILNDKIHPRIKGWINSMILSLLATHNYLKFYF